MLEVSQLSRTYGSFLAVDNVSFSINKGEIVGLLGHNGAGKTTIMKMISGYLESNTGSITVDGVNLEQHPKMIQRVLGYLSESLPIYPEMTVADYLDFVADLKGLSGNEKTSQLRQAIKATNISVKLVEPIATLSRGYKQRLGVAQAIMGCPKLLILDEPTTGLDPEQTQHMRELIREVSKDATIILSTHIMQEVEAVCTRVLMLHEGCLALDARLDEIQSSHHLLVETSLDSNAAQAIESCEGVKSLHAQGQQNGAYHYRIAVDKQAEQRTVAASIAAFIAQQKSELYALQPELRDLETLFREVNQGQATKKEINYAA